MILSVVGGKQMHYLVPELPALALLAARALGKDWGRRGGSVAPLGLVLLALGFALIALGRIDPAIGEGAVLGTREAWLMAAALAALAGAGVLLRTGAAHLVMGFGLALVLHLGIALDGFGVSHDTQPIAAALAPRMAEGVAVVGMPYNADFNFKARMTEPVAVPEGAEALAAWGLRHPQGWVIGPVQRAGIAAPPLEEWSYRGRPFGLWSVTQLPQPAAPGP